jgi:hypothetical protein
MTAQVSGFAAVSAESGARVLKGGAQVSTGRVGAQTVVFSLSGLADGETHLDIPVRLRSNVDFTLTTSSEKGGAALFDLSVVEVSGAGRFVHPGAAGRVEVSAAFDARRGARPSGVRDLSSPVIILRGPAVSAGGTLDSTGNMIEVVLRVVLKTPAGAHGRDAELKLSVAPRPKGS